MQMFDPRNLGEHINTLLENKRKEICEIFKETWYSFRIHNDQERNPDSNGNLKGTSQRLVVLEIITVTNQNTGVEDWGQTVVYVLKVCSD